MKYPLNQFNELVNVLKQFAVHFQLDSVHPCTLHYMVYQQISVGQTHNHLYCIEGGNLKKFHSMTDSEKLNAVKLIQNEFEFELYPDGCNDNHVETAVKKALKELNIN